MKYELLLPVGNSEMCLAAVHNGADAVYIGAPYFNARKRTTDFSVSELKEMIDYCHLYGVKVNLALNVVIFESELPKIISLLQEILPLGPDAIIVQDLGLARLIREISPSQKIHASTQMTVTNADAIHFLEDLSITRFVLGRENSLKEIKAIRENTTKELEVFVHGALCVAYSGQCFTSESIGGRSANRGQCAQSCRLDYELWVDEQKKELGDTKYLVSPKDLLGISKITELMEIGVNSFKVEGRLKTPEYVATSARNYREVMDGASLKLAQRTFDLSMTYSRGFFTGWLDGVDHQNLVEGSYSAHRGTEIGKVSKVSGKTITISSQNNLTPGMGLLFVGKKESGSKIFSVKKVNAFFEVELLNNKEKIEVGSRVFVNSHEAFDQEIKKSWSHKNLLKKIPLALEVSGRVGKQLQVKVIDPEGRTCLVKSELILEESKSNQNELIQSELSSLGSTAYFVSSFNLYINENVFIHQKELKKIRRSFIELITRQRTDREVVFNEITLSNFSKESHLKTKLNILFRKKDQVEFFVNKVKQGDFKNEAHLLGDMILDFEFGRDYAESVALLKSAGLVSVIATTRILKPLEYYNLKQIIRLNPDKVLVRNLGALEYLKQHSNLHLVGDFSLNVTNSYSADYLNSKGLSRLNVSYDLNQQQLFDLLSAFDPSLLEVTIHQYMPEFHMEHCVFAAFLSKGSSFKDCGKPCERHEVKLKDPYGNWHFLKADHECRNTFYKATPQSASFLIQNLMERGLESVRFEALNESPLELYEKVFLYLKLLSSQMGHGDVLSALKLKEVYGLGTGQLEKLDSYIDRKKG